MKLPEWIKRLLVGVGIGVGSAIPGVSGGTIAVIFNLYEKFVWAVSNIFKKFKEAFIILLPIVIGIVIGVVPMIILMDKALEGFLFGTVCVFAGFITGSIPKIVDEVKGEKPTLKNVLILVAALLLAVGLGVASVYAKTDVSSHFLVPEVWFYFIIILVGVVASVALVVPGISGSMLLILLGFYKPLITSTTDVAKQCLSGDWSRFGVQFAILGCFGIGVIVGFILVSKLMNFLLAKFHHPTFFGILGFVIGSDVALFVNYDIWQYYSMWSNGSTMAVKKEVEIPVGIALLIISMILAYLFVRLQRKYSQEEVTTKD